ncbi:MAG: DUF4255 domain-containing protein [Magnetococcales bacterium]|nr:DUF4255 domain-containing protein [Magnetococcales bacterium]
MSVSLLQSILLDMGFAVQRGGLFVSEIRDVLELVRNELDSYLRNANMSNEEMVILANIVDHNNAVFEETQGKVVMTLVNIEHDTTVSTYNRNVPGKNGQYSIVAPPMYINLYVMFFANFANKIYVDGLEKISNIISFFQQNNYFTHDTLPDLNQNIEKLNFDIVNLQLTDLNYLMGLVGTKYLPTVLYKVRMIPFVGDSVKGHVSGVKGVGIPRLPKTS